MAKIKAEFDTKTKDLKLTMNGEDVSDVVSAIFHTDWDDKNKGYVELTSVAQDDKEGMTRVSRIMANEEDFSISRDESVNAELSKLFLSRKKR